MSAAQAVRRSAEEQAACDLLGAQLCFLGQLDGGEGRASDSGLRLESDRLLVRVVGFGGKP